VLNSVSLPNTALCTEAVDSHVCTIADLWIAVSAERVQYESVNVKDFKSSSFLRLSLMRTLLLRTLKVIFFVSV